MRVFRSSHSGARTRLAAPVALLCCALFASATAAENASDPGDSYIGVWQLDGDASDPIGPLLEVMEAPWVARKMADVMEPTLTITPLGDGLRIVNENPIQTTDTPMPADGVERERKDPLGRKVVSSEVWNDAGELVVTQQNYVDADRIVVITSTWARVDDHLELRNRIDTDDGPMRIRRVFRAKTP
ncbi:MAG: hypothetical protein AAF430_24920 [Myxococcota bacterium]